MAPSVRMEWSLFLVSKGWPPMMSTLPAIHVFVQPCLGATTSHHHLLQFYFHQIVLELKWFILVCFLGRLKVLRLANLPLALHVTDMDKFSPEAQSILASKEIRVGVIHHPVAGDGFIKVEWRFVCIWDGAPLMQWSVIITWLTTCYITCISR